MPTPSTCRLPTLASTASSTSAGSICSASALAEFVRVAKPGGLVAYGDEGFAPDYPDGWRRRLLTRINPGYLRPRAEIPTGLAGPKERSVYGGLAYLLTAQKARPSSCSGA
jgi:hypothetical protein